jgi:hypothetical protein
MPDLISPILRRSFAFKAIAKDPKKPSYDYAMGLAGSQAMFLVLKESADQLASPKRKDAPIEAVIVLDTDYTVEHVPT